MPFVGFKGRQSETHPIEVNIHKDTLNSEVESRNSTKLSYLICASVGSYTTVMTAQFPESFVVLAS